MRQATLHKGQLRNKIIISPSKNPMPRRIVAKVATKDDGGFYAIGLYGNLVYKYSFCDKTCQSRLWLYVEQLYLDYFEKLYLEYVAPNWYCWIRIGKHLGRHSTSQLLFRRKVVWECSNSWS